MPRGVSKVAASKKRKSAVPASTATQKPAAKNGKRRNEPAAGGGAQVATVETSAQLKARLDAALQAVESAYKPNPRSQRIRTALPDFATLEALKAARAKANSELHDAKAAVLRRVLNVMALTRTTGATRNLVDLLWEKIIISYFLTYLHDTGKKAEDARKQQCGSGTVCLVPLVGYSIMHDIMY